MAKKTNDKELSGPARAKYVMPPNSVGIMLRRPMIKWLQTMLPRKSQAKSRRVRFFDLQRLGYQRSEASIMLLNWGANFRNMTFFGLVDENGKPATFCFLHLADAGMGVIVGTPIESVFDKLIQLNIEWCRKFQK